MDQTTFWHDSGGSQSSSISKRMWAAQCHDNMTGLYPGLDGFLPNILTEIVNTCPAFMIEAVKQRSYFCCIYYKTQHTPTQIYTHTHTSTYLPISTYIYVCIYVSLDLLHGKPCQRGVCGTYNSGQEMTTLIVKA